MRGLENLIIEEINIPTLSKEGTFEDRVQIAETKYSDNEMIMEQIAFIKEAMHSRRQILVAE